MPRRLAVISLSLLALSAGGAALAFRAPAWERQVRAPVAGEAERREADIAFFAARAARDPLGASERAHLAQLYLARARETGNFADYTRAESTARASLSMRTAHNTSAAVTLTSALLAQHRFVEARDVARALDEREPGVPAIQATLGEIELELGDYDAARAIFTTIADRKNLAVAPRLARWEEITGHPREASRILSAALVDAASRPSIPREQLAWFYWRVGDLALRSGHPDDAADAFAAGLRVRPDDYRILAAMARLESERAHWRRAIDFGERAIATSLDPATLGVLADAYLAIGDSARAEEHIRVMEVAVLTQPGALHRQWSLFLLDHGRDVPQVMAKVRAELETRRDIYGYDLLAWGLHVQGRDADAAEPMRIALSQGTRDAMLYAHAAAIARALGRVATADSLAGVAREIDPHVRLRSLVVGRVSSAKAVEATSDQQPTTHDP